MIPNGQQVVCFEQFGVAIIFAVLRYKLTLNFFHGGHMRTIFQTIAIAALLTCSGCGKADTSDARKEHILAEDHGWIDLTLSAPQQEKNRKTGNTCALSFSINGEPMLKESAHFAPEQDHQALIGYRFAAPAGTLQTELVLSQCVEKSYAVKLTLNLTKDHLAKLRFDGKRLLLQDASPYAPTTLEWLRSEVLKLQSNDQSTASVIAAQVNTLSTLTGIALASLALNLAMLVMVVRSRRRSA